MRGDSWLADDLLAYQEGLCSMGLVKYNSYLYEALFKKKRVAHCLLLVYTRGYRSAVTQNGMCARRCDLLQGASHKFVSVHGRTKVSHPSGQETKLRSS
jgi:hypothetical protein